MNFETTYDQNAIVSPDNDEKFEESSVLAIGVDAMVAPKRPARTKTPSTNNDLGVSSSFSSVESELGPSKSPKKSKEKLSSKESSSSSPNTVSNGGFKNSAKKSKKKVQKKKENSALPHDEQSILSLVMEELWASSGSSDLQALHALVRADETRDTAKNRQVAVQLGAPLLVVKKMENFPTDTAVQATGFLLLRCWGDMPSAPWYAIVKVGGLARALAVLAADVDEYNTMELQDNALTLVEQMTSDSSAAKLLVLHEGVESLVRLAQGRNGKFIPRALDSLCNICELAGTTGRKKVTQQVSNVIQTSDDYKLVSALISVLSEMSKDEDTVKGLLQGKGIDALAHAFKAYAEEKPDLSTKSFDLLLLLASDTGPASRQAIIESGVLKTLVKMTRVPDQKAAQKRGCQLVLALVVDQRKSIKHSEILEPISQIRQIHGEDDDVTKLAQDAMDAIVDKD